MAPVGAGSARAPTAPQLQGQLRADREELVNYWGEITRLSRRSTAQLDTAHAWGHDVAWIVRFPNRNARADT
jgi:hypothetical protein